MRTGLIFPGQGSQSVGMGHDLYQAFPVARRVFEEVDDTLKQRLSSLIFAGSQEDLTLTENAQPALMTVSLAVYSVLKAETGMSGFCVAGHSLGEYSALAAAGSLTISETAQLLKSRGQAMQKAVAPGRGAMLAVLGLEIASAEEIALKSGCVVANDNAPGQIILSGTVPCIEQASMLAQEKGARKCIPLSVSGPFHSPLMAPAAEVMAEILSLIPLKKPEISWVSNVRASFEECPATIKSLLIEQVTGRVRWRESILFMASEGVTQFVEIGAGKILTGLNKRIVPHIPSISIGTVEDIAAFLTQ